MSNEFIQDQEITFILWLGQPECHDLSQVGGKAATLSRLAADYPVPPGFCLTTGALATGAAQAPALPDAVEAAIRTASRELACRCSLDEPGVAVRSSAVDEDGSSASFAGQFETFLNIAGADAVVEAVVRCYQSARSERVRAYRRRQGAPSEEPGLAVLVQQLVPADVSAVVFSANPVTGDRGEVVINAGWGLGESIVGGTVTPDTFTVRRDGPDLDTRTVQRDVADKQRMTVSVPGGTREVAVPRFLREESTLDDEQVLEMARLALELEQRMGWPVDLECAYREETLYLLQCRPITTLQ